ncbi:EAL domain-containing protein [Thiomicrorhabdus sp. zzn3]|uniref:putative bifunctional diguanylate cyclase/phosphodiesterase n=1 Tax=Thiomicrorhabdus sp. zzn3 TaxID=3039775 RepID=UPI0024372759|nr:EAL domain-containing protein [Thiomicrorhabdus sp. zzn3]MDG6778189.1 EAL domain-containing protein [Thiomicrorhabdus sp. zzn3]
MLSLSFWLDFKQRQALALELANNLNEALSYDMLQASVTHRADVLANLSFRLSNFPSLDRVYLVNQKGEAVYEFKANDKNYDHLIASATDTAQFSGDDLYIRRPLTIEEQTYGYVTFIIDMKSFQTQLNEQLTYYVVVFPVLMVGGLLLASRISRRYSEPFLQLAHAMEQSDPTHNRFPKLKTQAQNEVLKLYDGYQKMMTQIAQTTQQMRYQSEHDQLTGLFNRYYIEQQILLAMKGKRSSQHALIYLDLDQFKMINDAAGTTAGDKLLKMVARECQIKLPKKACMARIGGDDFYILLKRVTLAEAEKWAQDLLELLHDFRFSWEGQAYSISASMGLVHFHPNQYTMEELSKAAETAFYQAKSAGRNKLSVFTPGDEAAQNYNQQVVTAGYLKEALSDGPAHFELFAQAIVPFQEQSKQASYEILLRLRNADGQLIAPDQFLAVAERYQLMAEIDRFVLWKYLQTVTDHPEHIENLGKAHINLAGSSLNHPDFQRCVQDAIQHFDFPWNKLELEITETSAIGNFNRANQFIDWLKSTGIGLALDDFGTGMSSFEYLKSLPFDVVKIDGSFVRDMHKDPSDKAVIRYIQEIASLRGQETVAEYVESEKDVMVLKRIGVTYGQGYHLGKPKPLSDWL